MRNYATKESGKGKRKEQRISSLTVSLVIDGVMGYVPQRRYVEVLTPSASECDLIWKCLEMGSL